MTEESEVFSVRFEKSLIDAISARVGPRGRNAFLKKAAWNELGRPARERSERHEIIDPDQMSENPTNNEDDLVDVTARYVMTDDEAELYELVQRGQITARMAERHLGWQGLRFSNAERSLMRMGLVGYESGMLVHLK